MITKKLKLNKKMQIHHKQLKNDQKDDYKWNDSLTYGHFVSHVPVHGCCGTLTWTNMTIVFSEKELLPLHSSSSSSHTRSTKYSLYL